MARVPWPINIVTMRHTHAHTGLRATGYTKGYMCAGARRERAPIKLERRQQPEEQEVLVLGIAGD